MHLALLCICVNFRLVTSCSVGFEPGDCDSNYNCKSTIYAFCSEGKCCFTKGAQVPDLDTEERELDCQEECDGSSQSESQPTGDGALYHRFVC
jgi:hypothetical protein